MTALSKTVPPNLALAPDAYERPYHDQLNNILRLYFNQLNSNVNSLVGPTGGSYINNVYSAVQRTTDVTFAAINTPYQITFDTVDYENGSELNLNDGIVVNYNGIYNYQFSVQLKNADTQIHSAWIWLRKNGVDLQGTGSKFDVTNKHGGVDGYVIAACNFYVSLEAGDSVEMWAAVSDLNVSFDANAAQTSPFAMPSIPSVVATLTFVSES